MCLILFANNAHPNYKLIIAANRDEFYKRETESAKFWEENQNILAGRDLEGGGTWLGVTKTGKIAMLTNYRDIANIIQNAPTRGKLINDFLNEKVNSKTYLDQIENSDSEYNGFNLIVGDRDKLCYLSNYKKGINEISSGIHGLSNHLLDTPWFKVEKGKNIFSKYINSNREISPVKLFDILYNDEKARLNNLPKTGLPLDKERQISSMFIKSPDYGSRCSTVVLIDRYDNLTFVERTYNTTDYTFSDVSYTFSILA